MLVDGCQVEFLFSSLRILAPISIFTTMFLCKNIVTHYLAFLVYTLIRNDKYIRTVSFKFSLVCWHTSVTVQPHILSIACICSDHFVQLFITQYLYRTSSKIFVIWTFLLQSNKYYSSGKCINVLKMIDYFESSLVNTLLSCVLWIKRTNERVVDT
jgi:hypothetical protein